MNRMAPEPVRENDSLMHWRVLLLFTLVFSGMLLSLLAFPPSVIHTVKSGLGGLLVLDITAWLMGIVLLLSPRMAYSIRAAIAWEVNPSHTDYETEPSSDWDLLVVNAGGSLIASSSSFDNAYEVVDFVTPGSNVYTVQACPYRWEETSGTWLGWAWAKE